MEAMTTLQWETKHSADAGPGLFSQRPCAWTNFANFWLIFSYFSVDKRWIILG